jgi:hypothetical protein
MTSSDSKWGGGINRGTKSMLGLTHVAVVERSHYISFRVFHDDADRMVPYLEDKGIETTHPSKSRMQVR